MHFDAWGKRYDLIKSSWDALAESKAASTLLNLNVVITNVTPRGFTGHEQVDSADIIHMNGRIYDPTLGRFLQADPHIQAPSNSQSYNRYSYVLNNPLSYTDPSGYFFKSLWKGVKNAFRAIAKVPILNAALQFAACSFGGPAGCAAYAAISTYAVTGSLKGALIGAFTAGIGGGQGFFTAGLIGGLASRAQGGNFGHGFWSAGIGALVGGKIRTGNAYMNVVVSAVIGGTVSKLTGGKFANGAQTWAFSAAMAQDWGATNAATGSEELSEYDPSH